MIVVTRQNFYEINFGMLLIQEVRMRIDCNPPERTYTQTTMCMALLKKIKIYIECRLTKNYT